MPKKYPHLPLRISADQLDWIDQQAAIANLTRSKWVKQRLGLLPPESPASNLSHLIDQWGQDEPQEARYTPSNPLSKIRETAATTNQVIGALRKIKKANLPAAEREQLEKAIASAQKLLKLCTNSARRERT